MFIALGLECITSNVRMTVNNELRRMVKEAILAYFELMFGRSISKEHSG